MRPASITSLKNISLGLLALLAVVPWVYSGPPVRGGAGISRGGAVRSAPVQHFAAPSVSRPTHGTIRHFDTHVSQRPVTAAPPHFEPRQHAIVHRDVDVDVNRPRHWHSFALGRRLHHLREGFVPLVVSGVPYFYDDGIYYQQDGDDYQEVYPPVGADLSQLPDGAIEIDADDAVYYYAGGAFYVQQGDGFVIAPTPIGVAVPELPPGAVPVTVNNAPAYQFNGVDYQPVFVDGVTQYVTFLP